MTGFRHLGERTIHQGRVPAWSRLSSPAPTTRSSSGTWCGRRGRWPSSPSTNGPPSPRWCWSASTARAIGDWLVEIPAGLRDKRGEPPEATAVRELAEEAGLVAERYELLGSFVNAAGMTDQRTFDLPRHRSGRRANQADGLEERYLSVERRPLADAVDAAARGELIDAKTVIGLLLAWHRLGG